MVRDLESLSEDLAIDTDVLVVGGGTVGLLLAVLLRKKGRRVVVLETGGREQTSDRHPLNEVVQIADQYDGAENGRFRCLGGTSTRWGGAMIPFLQQDLDLVPGWDGRWPLGMDAFTPYVEPLERLFGFPPTPYELPEILGSPTPAGPAFIPRLAKWPPFANRNVARLLRSELEAEEGPDIWLHATATAFKLDHQGRLGLVTAQSEGGRRLTVSAQEVVFAAGALESTRLLLLLDRAHDHRLFDPHGVLGRYFFDHVSANTADLVPKHQGRFNRIIGFRFEGQTMRNLRFEPSAGLRQAQGLPAGFAHITFASERPSGFDALRGILRSRQEGSAPSMTDLALLAKSAPWLAQAAWWRFIENRVLLPPAATFALNMVVEQEPVQKNRILLSPDRLDVFGRPLAAIDWRVGDADISHAVALTQRFVDFWRSSPLGELGDIHIKPTAHIKDELKSGGGIYHPGGSTRMGADPATAVVDADLRTFAVPNLSILATSIFPTGGGANPTMMLLLAGLRLADHLTRSL